MSKQTAVRLPDELHARLQSLAAKTGRTATYYIREAIEEHLEDLEDIYLAERIAKRIEEGKSRTYSLDELDKITASKQWKIDNADAISSSNEWIDKHGLPLDKYRQF